MDWQTFWGEKSELATLCLGFAVTVFCFFFLFFFLAPRLLCSRVHDQNYYCELVWKRKQRCLGLTPGKYFVHKHYKMHKRLQKVFATTVAGCIFNCTKVVWETLTKRGRWAPHVRSREEGVGVLEQSTCICLSCLCCNNSYPIVGLCFVLSFGLAFSVRFALWQDLEQFDPQTFFIVLLPPIIFESGYSLHKVSACCAYIALNTCMLSSRAGSVPLWSWFLGCRILISKISLMLPIVEYGWFVACRTDFKSKEVTFACDTMFGLLFFLALLQGNFFQNLGSILLFAVVGTAVSAVVVGGGMYGLGQVSLAVICCEEHSVPPMSLFHVESETKTITRTGYSGLPKLVICCSPVDVSCIYFGLKFVFLHGLSLSGGSHGLVHMFGKLFSTCRLVWCTSSLQWNGEYTVRFVF